MIKSDLVLKIAKKEENYLLKAISEFTHLTMQERENLRKIYKENNIKVVVYDF